MNDPYRISFAILLMAVIGIIFSQISQFYSVEGRELGNFKSKNSKSSPGKIKNKEIKYDKPSPGKIKNKEIKQVSNNKLSVKKRPDCAKNGSCIGGGPDNIKPISDKIPSKDGKKPDHKIPQFDRDNSDCFKHGSCLGPINRPSRIDVGDIDLNHFENVDLDIGDLENVDINVDDIDHLDINIDDLDIDADDIDDIDVNIDCDDCDDNDDDNNDHDDVTYVYQPVYTQPALEQTGTTAPNYEPAASNINNTSLQSYITSKVSGIIKSGTFKITSISSNTVITPVNDSGLALIGSAEGINNVGWIADGNPNQIIVITGLSDERAVSIADNSSNVQLADNSVTIGKNDLLVLGYLSQINDWVQIASKIT
jgi:hypothetical protein